jgi:adenylate cyclase
LLAIGCVLLIAAVAFAVFKSRRLLLDAATPGLSLLVLFGVLLVVTLAESTRQRRTLERIVQAQRERAAHVAGELAAAQRIQTGMLPRADLLRGDSRIDLAAVMAPAREVGGDLYDFFRLDRRRLFVLVGDVAGKGLSASMFMAVSKALYKSAALNATSATVGDLMTAVNVEVSRDNSEMFFVTAFAAILDLDSGMLDYCNAGHENPYAVSPDRGSLARLSGGGGPPLCAVDGFRYPSASHGMQAGELLCVVTDGVTEAQNAAGELYGSARLKNVLLRAQAGGDNAAAAVDAIRRDVDAFAAGAEPSDDMTIFVLRWMGARDSTS